MKVAEGAGSREVSTLIIGFSLRWKFPELLFTPFTSVPMSTSMPLNLRQQLLKYTKTRNFSQYFGRIKLEWANQHHNPYLLSDNFPSWAVWKEYLAQKCQFKINLTLNLQCKNLKGLNPIWVIRILNII